MRRVVIAVGVILAFAGLGLANEDGVDLRRWIGKHRAELAEGWGKPQDLKQRRGGEVIVYEVFAGSSIVESWTPCLSNVNLGLREEVYKISFWVDSDGRITKVKPKVLKFEPDSDLPADGEDSEPSEFLIDRPSRGRNR
jgi:hypothetical protein